MANPPPNARKKRKPGESANTSWNTWQPGSGRKGWSPFTHETPKGAVGPTLDKNGNVDWKAVIDKANNNGR